MTTLDKGQDSDADYPGVIYNNNIISLKTFRLNYKQNAVLTTH